MDEMFEIIKAGAPDAPPEQALYRIQQTYPDGSGGRLNMDWEGLLRLHELIHDRIALEGRVCETCGTKGCHRPATWEIECRGAGLRSRLIYTCDEHVPDEAILSPQDEIRRLVEECSVSPWVWMFKNIAILSFLCTVISIWGAVFLDSLVLVLPALLSVVLAYWAMWNLDSLQYAAYLERKVLVENRKVD